MASPAAQVERPGAQFRQFVRLGFSQFLLFANLRRRKRNRLTAMNAKDTAVLFLTGFSDHFNLSQEDAQDSEEGGF